MQRDVRVEQIVCDVWRFVCAVLRKLLRFENHVLAMEKKLTESKDWLTCFPFFWRMRVTGKTPEASLSAQALQGPVSKASLTAMA